MLEDYHPIEEIEPAREAQYSDFPLSPTIKNVFSSRGIEHLYRHQAEGIMQVQEGKNVVIVAPTAGGKSEVFIVPAVDGAVNGDNTLLLYPTKALARDQHLRFSEFALYGVRTETYDGDTPQGKREKIRASPPQIIISNMDMLHFILLNNRLFTKFFEKLKYVVLDEVHIYSGIFGAHASNVLWRLKRLIKKKYNRDIQFIATSATVGNAKEFSEGLCGEEFVLVEGDSSPRSEFHHLLISPPESYSVAALRIADDLGRKALIFGNSHSLVERMGMMASRMNIPLAVYRSGLRQDDRRKVESDFKAGRIKYLATTSALELGIDIGDTDVVVLAGFPGTITRVRQRIGRCGRKGQKGYGIFVAKESPLDQYYVENTNEYLHGEPENCYINPKNENVRKLHTLSAAKDMMFSPEEIDAETLKILESLEEEELLKKWGNFYSTTKEGAMRARLINLRSAGASVKIYNTETEKRIGERGVGMALKELFEGAIYLHGGRPYFSKKLDLEKMEAWVEPMNRAVEEYTSALSNKSAEVVEELASRECLGHKLSFGKVHITEEVYGFIIKDMFGSTKIGEHTFETPYIHEYDTYALWIDVEDLVYDIPEFGDGLHAFEHVSISMMPAITGADPKELGGLSYPSGRMYVYDSVEDGNGVTQVVFSKFEKIVQMTKDRLEKCDCEKGCPKCILDPMCGNDNRYLNKESGKLLAEKLLKG
jgi:DEAD/DEAH box helicase domain-containing protein